eukprot:m.52501 g.52501  ORF g.52501 m.52501 type:complete len:80 (+) comp34213_c0_seq1:220-459(+)
MTSKNLAAKQHLFDLESQGFRSKCEVPVFLSGTINFVIGCFLSLEMKHWIEELERVAERNRLNKERIGSALHDTLPTMS